MWGQGGMGGSSYACFARRRPLVEKPGLHQHKEVVLTIPDACSSATNGVIFSPSWETRLPPSRQPA